MSGWFVISGGLVISGGREAVADIVIGDGRIAAVGAGAERPTTATVVDVSGMVVLPGAIDGHTHFIQNDVTVAEPSTDEFEGFTSGGAGAAAGGVTTVVEMPQANPPAVTLPTFVRKAELAAADAIIDFGLWAGVRNGQSADELLEMVDAGAAACKAYMCNSDPTFPAVDDYHLALTFEALHESRVPFGIHCENDALLHGLRAAGAASGRTDAAAYSASRPAFIEVEAVHRALFFAERFNTPLHVVHVSAAESARLIRDAKARGVPVTCETCPQYLTLDAEAFARIGPLAKFSPPLRSARDVEELWEQVFEGTIDAITSDHCAFTLEYKHRGAPDMFAVGSGAPGVQTLFPVFADNARKRGMSWSQIAELTSSGPARVWGLAPRKGSLDVGADADVIVVNPDANTEVRGAELLHAQRYTPFEGMPLGLAVRQTYVRGALVYDSMRDPVVDVRPGSGEFIRRTGARR